MKCGYHSNFFPGRTGSSVLLVPVEMNVFRCCDQIPTKNLRPRFLREEGFVSAHRVRRSRRHGCLALCTWVEYCSERQDRVQRNFFTSRQVGGREKRDADAQLASPSFPSFCPRPPVPEMVQLTFSLPLSGNTFSNTPRDVPPQSPRRFCSLVSDGDQTSQDQSPQLA